MSKATTPKYSIGQEVHYQGDPEGVNGTVKSYRVTEDAVIYDITSTEVDVAARALIDGVKHVFEDELDEVKPSKN
jgi:hypothetical protein